MATKRSVKAGITVLQDADDAATGGRYHRMAHEASNQSGTNSDTPRLLDARPYRAWWVSRLLSQTAQSALLYGLLLLIIEQTQASIYTSLFVVCSILPSLLFGLIGGWASDRMPQRAFLTLLNVLRAAVILPLLRDPSDLRTLFLVTLGIWTVHQFYSPGESAVMARIIPLDRLADGTSMGNFALTIAQIAGMVILAPLLLRLPDTRVLFAICTVGYAAAAVFVVRIGRLAPRRGEGRSIPFNLRRGWQVAVSSRPAFNAFADAVLIAIGLSSLIAVVPAYLEHVLNTSASNTVFVFAPAVIGMVAGLRVAPPLGRWLGHGRIAFAALLGFALSAAAFGAIDTFVRLLGEAGVPLGTIEDRIGLSTRTATTMIVSIPAGFFSAIVNVGARAVLLEIAPDDARGQVFATQSVIGNAGALVPTLMAGLAVDLLGARPVALALAGALIAGALAAWRHARTLPEFAPRDSGALHSTAHSV